MKDESQRDAKSSGESRRGFLQAVAVSAVAAGAGCQTARESATEADVAVPAPVDADWHICKGLNVLTQQGKGPGECDCANVPEVHGCAGGNSCAGLGGCGTGDYATQYWVAENLCGKHGDDGKWNGTGGCGSPIGYSNTGFVETQLNNAVPTPQDNPQNLPAPFVGVPVWAIARARFEQKMVKLGRSFGKPDLNIPGYTANTWSPGDDYQRNELPEPYPDPMPPQNPPVQV